MGHGDKQTAIDSEVGMPVPAHTDSCSSTTVCWVCGDVCCCNETEQLKGTNICEHHLLHKKASNFKTTILAAWVYKGGY